jgi:hypothetical protein
MSCSYEMWDGAYVLGSLSPAERREFEEHLDGCVECSRAVRDLAGLPGLLSRIGPEVFEAGPPEPVPETLLPRLNRAVRGQQRRRTWLTAGAAAAAAAAITIGGAVALEQGDSHAPASNVALPAEKPMTSVSSDPMKAKIALTSVAWGTRLDLTCIYPKGTADSDESRYALVVNTADGRSEQVATWRGTPGRTMHLTAATAASLGEIRSVDLTWSDGAPVATLQL